MADDTWVLVANASRARLYALDAAAHRWVLLQEMAHPDSRANDLELSADKPGRVQQKDAHVYHASMEPRTEPKKVEAQRFAREIAAVLEKGFGRNAYRRLMLVAPPHFLGLLRASLDPQVAKRVEQEHDKDYVDLDVSELDGRLLRREARPAGIR